MSPYLSIVGLIASLAGVITLFRYGMPYRIRTEGKSFLLLEQEDHEAIELEKRYAVYGWIGLVLVATGTLFQIVANVL